MLYLNREKITGNVITSNYNAPVYICYINIRRPTNVKEHGNYFVSFKYFEIA